MTRICARLAAAWLGLALGVVGGPAAADEVDELASAHPDDEAGGVRGSARPDGWDPDDGETTEATRRGPGFLGLGYFHPIRLHLGLGGHVEGTFGGVDPETSEVLLVLPTRAFRIDFGLISGVTPLGSPGGVQAGAPAPEILDRAHVETRLMPTWRSHAGVALSLLAPGVGQFIQTKRRDRELGILFLATELFFAGGAVIAAFVAPNLDDLDRRLITATFVGLGISVAVAAAIHAFEAGRERREVTVDGGRLRRRGGVRPP